MNPTETQASNTPHLILKILLVLVAVCDFIVVGFCLIMISSAAGSGKQDMSGLGVSVAAIAGIFVGLPLAVVTGLLWWGYKKTAPPTLPAPPDLPPSNL